MIRTLEDAEKIGQMIPKNGQTVVIGGGVLGLEAAWELKKAGCQVTVLEAAPVLMGRQLDEGAAAMLGSIAESVGIKVRTGVKIDRIEGQERVTGRSSCRWGRNRSQSGADLLRCACKYRTCRTDGTEGKQGSCCK